LANSIIRGVVPLAPVAAHVRDFGGPDCTAKSPESCRCNGAAEKKAKEMGVIADYDLFDTATADMVNGTLSETKELLPGIKLPHIGVPEDCQELFAQTELDRMNSNPDYDSFGDDIKEAIANANAKENAEQIAKYTESSKGEMFISQEDGIVFVKKHNAENLSRLDERAREAQEYQSIAVGTGKGMIDHEIGHHIDNQLRVSSLPEVQSLYSASAALGRDSGMSYNASLSPREFVAECWSEYRNIENPRPAAKMIGEIVVREHDKLYNT